MAKVVIEDLSGGVDSKTDNPYDGLIDVCKDDSRLIQERYHSHRVARNTQQKEKILADDFAGWILDDYLVKLDGPQKDESFRDERNCLVFWTRPPRKVKNLINVIQQKLQDAAPDLWIMPVDNLHMTLLEVTFSKTPEQIEHLVNLLMPNCEAIADYPMTHRARLIKPMISFDAAALALSFVPAAGESLSEGRRTGDDAYTYHHLRRDVYSKVKDGGIPVGSRYVVPSAHLTIARFNTPNPFGGDLLDPVEGKETLKRRRWLREIDTINQWLEAEYWPKSNGKHITAGGEWIVGEEKGLDFRKGTLWYGGGETVYLGKGF